MLLLLALSPAAAFAAPASPDLSGLKYAALGDSYSAGFGLTPFSATSPFAATPSTDLNGCYQAEANYPHLVAATLGLALADETCSGAVTANITTTPQQTMTGQTAPSVQDAALGADTDIVTISIGGNDLGFATVAMNCIREWVSLAPLALITATPSPAPQSCEEYYTAPAGRWTGQPNLQDVLTGTVAPALKATFDAISAKAPSAKVFVVGYPQIATSDATKAAGCFSQPLPPDTDTVPFAPSDILWLSTVEQGLDSAIESAVSAQGSRWTYVSSWSATADHTLCDDESWITKITLRYPTPQQPCDPQTEQTLAYDSFTACLALGALHPNSDGVASLHAKVVAAITGAFAEDVGREQAGGTTLAASGGEAPGAMVAGGILLLAGSAVLVGMRKRRRDTEI